MKSKEEIIEFWIGQSEEDWSVSEVLYKNKKYLQSLFFGHLVIEKICKAKWIKDNSDNVPPKTHNLILLLSKTTIKLSDEQSEFLLNLNRFQLEGRYPDYLNQIQNICNENNTKELLLKIDEVRLWLLNQMQ